MRLETAWAYGVRTTIKKTQNEHGVAALECGEASDIQQLDYNSTTTQEQFDNHSTTTTRQQLDNNPTTTRQQLDNNSTTTRQQPDNNSTTTRHRNTIYTEDPLEGVDPTTQESLISDRALMHVYSAWRYVILFVRRHICSSMHSTRPTQRSRQQLLDVCDVAGFFEPSAGLH
jgi:hypothetical protein